MSTQRLVYTFQPYGGVEPDFFSDENVAFLLQRVTQELRKFFSVNVKYDVGSVKQVMHTIAAQRPETIPKMNQRVIMQLTKEFRTHHHQLNKHLAWQEGFVYSQQLVDPVGGTRQYDNTAIKISNRLGRPRVGSTLRWYST